MFISVEGIDGAGKTVISKMLSKKYNYAYTGQKELAEYFNINEQTYLDYCGEYKKKAKYDKLKIFMLYALSCFLVSSSDENIICDRHLPTVYFWYGDHECLEIADMIYRITKKPDVTFVIEVSKENALRRTKEKYQTGILSEKAYIEEKMKVENAENFVPKVVEYLDYFNMNYFVVDGNKSINEVFNEICEHINNIKL